MTYTPQKDDFGCGVACVANLVGAHYADALHLFDNPDDAKTKGYACKYVVDAVRRSGIDVRLHHISRKKPVPRFENGTIVFLERSKRYPFQHYLLRVSDGWVDPWINMHSSRSVNDAKAGIRKRLPGRPYYAIY